VRFVPQFKQVVCSVNRSPNRSNRNSSSALCFSDSPCEVAHNAITNNPIDYLNPARANGANCWSPTLIETEMPPQSSAKNSTNNTTFIGTSTAPVFWFDFGRINLTICNVLLTLIQLFASSASISGLSTYQTNYLGDSSVSRKLLPDEQSIFDSWSISKCISERLGSDNM